MSDEPLKVSYVQRIRRRDGRVDLYFRKGEHREGPLKSSDATPELQAEVDFILARLETVARAQKPKPGSIGGYLQRYRGSDRWRSLAQSTQAHYGRLASEIQSDLGCVPIRDVTRAWLRDLRDAWAVRGHKATYDRMQVLKNALIEAMDDGSLPDDPFHGLKKVRRPSGSDEAHPIWTDAEVAAAIEGTIERGQPGLARAIALGRWAGFRRGTICAIPLHARIVGADDEGNPQKRLYWVTQKRKVLCDKREDARLTSLLDRTPARALTIAYNSDEQPFKPRQFNQALDRHMARLATEGKVRAGSDADGVVYCPLDIHGLRHSRGTELAEAGASEAEIMSQLEHATDRAARIYRRQAERKRMADAAQGRVDQVIQLRSKKGRTAGEQPV